MNVTAAILREGGAPLTLETVELTQPRPNEVRVRLSGTGICHTDLGFSLMATAEQLPLVLGHEGAGVVEAVGSDVTTVTARQASDLGYRTIIVADACSAADPASHDASIASLGLLAEITTSAEVLEALAVAGK